MAYYDFDPPSFSLGLDLETRPDPLPQPAKRPSTSASPREVEEDDYNDAFKTPVRVTDQSRAFKRLRRGPKAVRPALEPRRAESIDGLFDVIEEIEDFSSDEDCPRGRINSVCSSSKPSLLHKQGVVTTESGTQFKSNKDNEVPYVSASKNVEINDGDTINPKLTVSPVRRYQLIDSDSDSDDPSMIQDPCKEEPVVNLSLPKNEHPNSSFATRMRTESTSNSKSEDLWKDFHSDHKSLRVPTPAFDELLEEYFDNAKNKSKPENSCKDSYNETKLDKQTHPPAHGYFFHRDLRVQKLVRDRLPYFFPLGVGNNKEYEQQNGLAIDYLGQFCHEDSKQTNQKRNIEKSSRGKGSKRPVKQSHVQSVSEASTSWVNPRTCAGLQKNGGSRRVQAVSKSAGHWYTGPDGKRVYVNKQGKELTGQIAYRHYKKESGMGFKTSKKKNSATKKAAANKSASKKK
ncbi:Unknown protein [Striga hermonthica]|uniref:Uncharacterized protein n=1 Tax=Striga hermonthica TaxID=68872 RepID=A0A9N7MQ61_STRHE|nr:Unknown protein [Striga hermonthica]